MPWSCSVHLRLLPMLPVVGFALACGGAGSSPETPPEAAITEALPQLQPREAVSLDGPFTAIAAGRDLCGLASDGSVRCWQGLGARGFDQPEHAERSLQGKYTAVAAGEPYVGGVGSDGSLVGWFSAGDQQVGGAFTSAQFGEGFACGIDAGHVACLPMETGDLPPVPTGEGFTEVAGDARGGCALGVEAQCWGSWQDVVPAGELVQVAIGKRWACGLDGGGNARCWGEAATAVSGPMRDIGVAAVAPMACGLREDGVVACWSDTVRYAVAATAGSFTQLTVGRGAACGLRDDGGVDCWPLRQRPQ